jgi:hypothetical protein
MATLPEKWQDKDGWLRCLEVQASMMWLFRQDLVKLELGELRWLDGVLRDTLLAVAVHAPRASTAEDAFRQAIELLRANIDGRIASVGADAELKRLRQIAFDAEAYDPIREYFKRLASSARAVYRRAPSRQIELYRQWINDHPIPPARPNGYVDRFHVTAHTASGPNRSIIELRVHLDGFDVPSLLAIPTLFTHELVCHAYANESGSDVKSIWAEGVMDWTSSYFFRKWTSRLKLLPYTLIKSAGDDLRQCRMTPERFTGIAIADTLFEWFCTDGLVRGTSMAELATARYTVEINSAGTPLLDKDSLASRIANIWTDEALQGDLRSWLAGRLPASAMLA